MKFKVLIGIFLMALTISAVPVARPDPGYFGIGAVYGVGLPTVTAAAAYYRPVDYAATTWSYSPYSYYNGYFHVY